MALAEAGRRSRLTVVVDGLDEATSPLEAERIARTLLVPLAADGNVAVLVGTRRGYDGRLVRAFGSRAVVIDLDDPAYLELEDLVAYAAASLRLDQDPASTSPYRDHPATDAVARAIASAANPSFLVAGLAARARAEDVEVIDTTVPGWQADQRFPTDVGAAMADYLQRVASWELLVPVAYARPPGLPRDTLWAAMAEAYASRPVGNAEIDALRHSAASYLVETTLVGGEPTVSLFHQALVDHVRGLARGPAVEAAFTEVLTRRAVEAGGWPHADDYTRRHLASHAAAAGRLDELFVDPGFLLAAEPHSLVSALGSLRSRDARLAGSAYQLARHRLERASASDRPAYLELAARRVDATALADRTQPLAGEAAWHAVWATRARVRRILTRHRHFAFTLAVADVGGETVVVSGGPDGLVRATEAGTSSAVGAVETDEGVALIARADDPVGCVVVGLRQGAPHAIASFANGLVRACEIGNDSPAIDIVAAHEPAQPETGHWTLLAAAASHPLLATCGMDEVIRIRNLDDDRVGVELRHPGGVRRLATGELDGSPVLVSGGFDGTVRLWDFVTGRQLGRPYRAGAGQVHTLATIMLDDRLVVLASPLLPSDHPGYGRPGSLQAWDARTGRSVPHLTDAGLTPGALGAATIRGQPVIALAELSRLSLVDGRSGARLTSEVFTDNRTIVLVPADVNGGVGVVAGQDRGVVELIMVDEIGEASDSADPELGSITDARVARGAGVIVGGILAHERVRLWDLTGGSARRVPELARSREASAFDVVGAGGRVVAVAASAAPERILAWEVETGEVIADLEAADAAQQVAVAQVEDRTLVVGVGGRIRVWDLAAGPVWQAELPWLSTMFATPPRPVIHSDGHRSAVLWWDASASRAWDLLSGRRLAATPRRRSLSAAALVAVGQQVVGVLGTESGSVLTWDLRTGRRLHAPFRCGGLVSALASGGQAGDPTILAAGEGVWEWSLTDGRLVRAPRDQPEAVTALAFILVGDERMLCTGLDSGRVRVPELDLALDLDDRIEDIWGISGDRFVVATASGIVAVHVGRHPSQRRA